MIQVYFAQNPVNLFKKIYLIFSNKTLDFFQPVIYYKDIEDMFIFDYNPLLIYLYSPQKEQISLSALFIIIYLCFSKCTNEFIDIFYVMCIIKTVQEQRRSDHRIGAPFFVYQW